MLRMKFHHIFLFAIALYLRCVAHELNKRGNLWPRVLFMLPSLDVSGGNISILQEVIEMRRKGAPVYIAVSRRNVPPEYVKHIMALSSSITAENVAEMIIMYKDHCCWPNAPSKELLSLAQRFDIVVATYHTTVVAIDAIVGLNRSIMPAYYVQDYEPWFTCSPFDCPFRGKLFFYNRIFNKPLVTKENHFKFTLSTYTAASGNILLFAKTNWTKNMVETHHKGTHVKLVTPSIDHTVYRTVPNAVSERESFFGKEDRKVRIIAMLRPRTPRRNSLTCLDTLLKMANEYPHLVHISFFGVERSKLYEMLHSLNEIHGFARHRARDVVRSRIRILGLIKQRITLANLYRQSDLFIDMSWWQAFGRTAVEAMACGCVPVMPSLGAGEYVCLNGRACLFHDGTDASGYFDVVLSLVLNHTKRLHMMEIGIERCRDFSIRKASSSIFNTLQNGLIIHRKKTK